MEVVSVCKKFSSMGRFDLTKVVNNLEGFGIGMFSDSMCEGCMHFSSRSCKMGYR